jgi:hypothetical protein
MRFEKKVAVPKERAIFTKAAALQGRNHTKEQTLQIVKEAMSFAEEKFQL